MASGDMWDVLRQAQQLPPEQQLELLARLAERIRNSYGDQLKPKRRRSWLELEGAAPYPLLGEDAQAWVTRTRREGDEHREQMLRGDR